MVQRSANFLLMMILGLRAVLESTAPDHWYQASMNID
jgi:hypothetical protein